MNYLICQDYPNTSNNHAGMKHMCKLLKKNYPDDYEVIVFPHLDSKYQLNILLLNKALRILNRYLIVPFKYRMLGCKLKNKLKNNDRVFLLEYLMKSYPQIVLAKYLKRRLPDILIYGLVHLVPKKIKNNFTIAEIQKWTEAVDVILTLGSSLTQFFTSEINVPSHKVKTLFHYVDLDYYKPGKLFPNCNNKKPVILIQGNQERNYDILQDIIKQNSNSFFIICQGVKNLSYLFGMYPNVKLMGFISEDDLLNTMQEADISLNVMDDTIGSNVITTSLAVGMVMIVSDVGSIRDYCDNSFTVFCNNNNIDSFSEAIKTLTTNFDLLKEMKKQSYKKSLNFSIEKFHEILTNV